MLDEVELNHKGEQYILVQNERNSIALRGDEVLLFDHTGGIFTCDGCARDSYFCVPAET